MNAPATYSPRVKKPFLLLKIEALQARTALLKGLAKVVTAPGVPNIKETQWGAINNQLSAVANRILLHLQSFSDQLLPDSLNGKDKDKLADALGEIELELSEAYSFYDTYMDILTQRLSPVLGPLLASCDIIAADGLKHSFLAATTQNPIVYCDRGFGASILREGVRITHTANPVAFIAIPYSRLAEKYNLISIYHEVGHQALSKLQLVELFGKVFTDAVRRAGGNLLLQGMFANWSREIIPDFWAFGHTGMGQTSSMRDVLLVPRALALQVSPYQQHPPAYLRFLISVEWCRNLWGRGAWDDWAEEWEMIYPTRNLDPLAKQTLHAAKKLLPAMANAVITTKFKKLGNKPITYLFDLNCIAPDRLRAAEKNIQSNPSAFAALPVGVQLSAFRLLRDKGQSSIDTLNEIIRKWLLNLNQLN